MIDIIHLVHENKYKFPKKAQKFMDLVVQHECFADLCCCLIVDAALGTWNQNRTWRGKR